MEILENRLEQQIQIFNSCLHSQLKHLSFEGVHNLRVSTRRLRAVMDLLEKNTFHQLSRGSRKTLKKLGRTLGTRREWDVTLRGAKKYHLESSKLLKSQRVAGVHLQALLRSPEVQRFQNELADFAKSLEHERVSVQGRTLQKIRRELRGWLHQKHFSKNELHQLRISTKKMRYIFETLELRIKELKELQDQLGEYHDLRILSEYFDQAKKLKKDEQRKRQKVQKQIRPALRSSLDVLDSLR